MGSVLWNLRIAVRTLALTPAFTLVTALILGLGIGATTALYSAVDAVLLRPSPYPAAAELVYAERMSPRPDAPVIPWPYDHYALLRDRGGPFSDVAAFAMRELNFGADGQPARLRAEFATDNFLPILRITPVHGRSWRADAGTDGVPEILISDRLWRERFARDADVIGRDVRLNGVTATVVGVLPAAFRGESGDVDIWLPVHAVADVTGDRTMMQPFVMWLSVIGRLRPGIDAAAASAHLHAVNDALVADGEYPLRLGDGMLAATPLLGSRVDPAVRRAIVTVFAAAVAVLMIACLNIAGLLLARSRSREREIAVRRALGATSWRLSQQFMAEGLVLAVIGGAVGVFLSVWMLDVLRTLQPTATTGFWSGYARAVAFHEIALDGRVLRFALLVTVGSGLLFGVLPALRSGVADLMTTLRAGPAATRTPRRGTLGAGSLLVVGEIALTLVLLAAAGLFTRSFLAAHGTHFGFEPDRVISMSLNVPATQYPSDRLRDVRDDLERRMRTIPGITHVALSSGLPLTGRLWDADFVPVGETGEDLPLVRMNAVSPDYFDALGIRLRSGRGIEETDRRDAPQVAVINVAAAQRYWPGENPVGRLVGMRVTFGNDDPVEIVGVVEDVQYGELGAEIPPMVYVPATQRTSRSFFVTMRTRGAMAETAMQMRQQLTALDPELAVSSLHTMREHVSLAASRTRFGAVLISMFAVLAALLAALGTYGLMTATVAARTREVAIRMALGGHRTDVLRTVMTEGVTLAAAGIVLGLLGAFTATRAIGSQLFGVQPHDPLTLGIVVAGLAAVAFLALLVPALRAARVDPMYVLRHD
jgi:putative ABC transport system permease protein